MKFKNLVLTLGVLMMLAFTSMAAAAPSQVNRSMTAINAAKAEIPAVCELVGYNVDGDTSIITFKDPNTLERYVVDVNTATAKVQEIEVKGATFVMGSTMVTKTPDDIEKIVFSSKVHRGMLSHSVSFNDINGEHIFKVFVTRNENREIIKDQFDKFIALRDSF